MVFLFHCSSSLYSVVKAFSFEQNVTMSYNLIAYGALFKKKAICGVQLINHSICQDCISNSLLCRDGKFNYITISSIFFCRCTVCLQAPRTSISTCVQVLGLCVACRLLIRRFKWLWKDSCSRLKNAIEIHSGFQCE